MQSLKSGLQAVLLSLLLFSSVSWAASESVGRVIVSRGEVVAEQLDGVVRVLKRRAKIFAGVSIIVTLAISIFFRVPSVVLIVQIPVLIVVLVFIWSRPRP